MPVPDPNDSPTPACDASGDPERMSSSQLLPLVYEELRRLAAARLSRERNGAAMQATSLVHAAYLRLIHDAAQEQAAWDGRAHFFGAAALAMRRILVERARQRGQLRRGGELQRVDDDRLDGVATPDAAVDSTDVLALDGALDELERSSPELHRVVMLRYFAGLSIEAAAELLETSPSTVKRRWAVARFWLCERMGAD